MKADSGESAILRPESLAAFGDWFRRQRKSLGITLDELMAKTGISKPYLSNIETGRIPGAASEEKLRRIARALGLSEDDAVAAGDWLRTPESVRRLVAQAMTRPLPRRNDGAIDLDAAVRRDKIENGGEEFPVRPVPLINRVAAGHAAEHGDLDYPRGVADQYVPVPDLPEAPVKSAFGVKVIGDSMTPEYAEGEILIVGPAGDGDAAVQDGDDCVVRLGEAENFATTFKRIYFVRDTKGVVTGVRLVPLNPI